MSFLIFINSLVTSASIFTLVIHALKCLLDYFRAGGFLPTTNKKGNKNILKDSQINDDSTK